MLGSLFDRIGLRAMILATVISAAAAPLVFLGGFAFAVLGMVCWGIGTGAQDSIMRATVSQLAPQDRRATAFAMVPVDGQTETAQPGNRGAIP
jgi:MFS family permease